VVFGKLVNLKTKRRYFLKTDVKLPGDDTKKQNVTKKTTSTTKLIDRKEEEKPFVLPFKKITGQPPRLKLFLWGESGVGKTPFALNFPSVAVIDMERGATPYSDIYPDTYIHNTTDPVEVFNIVKELAKGNHQFKTLVIDPISIYWESLLTKWSDTFLKRNKGGKGYKYEYYEMQPGNWNTLKAEWKALVRHLLDLDMNVVVIARAKDKYKDGEMMKKTGLLTFDAEKNLHYAFDTVVHMEINDKGDCIGICQRDRWRRIPKDKSFICAEDWDFATGYNYFKKCIGINILERNAQTVELDEEAEIENTPSPKKTLIDKTNKKASEKQETKTKEETKEEPTVELANKDQIDTIKIKADKLKISSALVKKRLASYGATGYDDLTSENAAIIIGKLEAAIEAKKKA
jgi:hypothetical protein